MLRTILLVLLITGSLLGGCSQGACPNACPVGAPPQKASGDAVRVYYFHRTARCPSCNKIEALSEQAVRTHFPVELEARQVEWLPTNVDDAASAHFVDDFSLNTQSLVLVRMADDQQVRWKNLERVWDLLDDEAAFMDYVATELRAMLDESSPGKEATGLHNAAQ